MKVMSRLALATAIALAGAGASQAAKERTNDAKIYVDLLESLAYTETSHSVTEGQPYDGVTTKIGKPSVYGVLTVKAGRKTSKTVAEWFRKQVANGSAVGFYDKNLLPKELNFAVAGTLSVKADGHSAVCDNVVFAQGKHGAFNDWWVGGPNLSNTHTGSQLIQTCKMTGSATSAAVLIQPAGSSESFTVSINPITSTATK